MIAPSPRRHCTTNARLAAAVASFIKAEEILVASCEAVRAHHDGDTARLEDQIEARKSAFNTLKTTFETEFPK